MQKQWITRYPNHITPEHRLKKIASIASGFVYCVSRTGITGESEQLNPQLEAKLLI